MDWSLFSGLKLNKNKLAALFIRVVPFIIFKSISQMVIVNTDSALGVSLDCPINSSGGWSCLFKVYSPRVVGLKDLALLRFYIIKKRYIGLKCLYMLK